MIGEDVVELCRGGTDREVMAIRDALAEAGIESRIVLGKHAAWASTPTVVYVRRADADAASAILRERAEADRTPAREYENNWKYLLAGVAIVAGIFMIGGLASGSPWLAGAAGAVFVASVAGAVVQARRG
jgi:hypothetical protein